MDPDARPNRRSLLISAVAVLVALTGLALSTGAGVAAPSAVPKNTAEPSIRGRAEQGRTLTSSTGSWSGTQPISLAYQWVRCGTDGGRADGGDCTLVSGATTRRYVLTRVDVGSRMRIRVTASNADGSATVASNPTATVLGAPRNTSIPSIAGTMVSGSVVSIDPGAWVGREPISFSYRWIRCNAQGGECASIAGAAGRAYRLTSSDVSHRMRVQVTARNAIGSTTVLSGESAIVTEPLPSGAIRLASGEISIPASSVPSDHRLVVSRVTFSPNPITNRRRVITVRVRTKDTRGYVVRDALVFVRSTPRVTTGGDRQITTADGWVTYQLAPTARFPLPRPGFHVQFFVKAYRSGDPPLAGIAAYRLVQVRLAGRVR